MFIGNKLSIKNLLTKQLKADIFDDKHIEYPKNSF